MKKLILFLTITFLVSCKNVGVTDNEVNAVQSVLDFYGGECIRSKGFEQTNKVKEVYFELELSKSDLVESYADMLEVPASNIAYLFYSNLKEEKDNYTHIRVALKMKDGRSVEFSYPVSDVKEVGKFLPVLDLVSDKIKAHDYKGLCAQFDVQGVDSTIQQVGVYCNAHDSAYGEVKETQFQGFSISDPEKGQSVVALFGIMEREKSNIRLSVVVDKNTGKPITFRFKF